MKTIIILIVTLLISTNILYSQSAYTNVMIGSNYNPHEVSISINPKNINKICAGANLNIYYYSSNGGTSWIEGYLQSTYTVISDPAIFVDTVGSFYYLHLVYTGPLDRIVCQKSTNGGADYNNGTYTGYNPPKEQDKPWGVADFIHGPRGNWIYVTWTQFDVYGSNNPADSSNILFSRSTDGGATWDPAIGAKRINQKAGDCWDSDNTMEGAVPCIGPNGEVYVSWAGPLSSNNFKIFFTSSTDGGTTWLTNNVIAGSQPGGWDYFINGLQRSNGQPITCCDVSSGQYRGTIYINYSDSAGPGDHDVKIIKSTNGGINWSDPIRVNDDPAGKEQFFTWMTIDQVTGYLYTVFYDRRNYADANTDVFMARSTDGGNTWINERISASPFTPTSSTFFGDYNNITAANGRVRPMWTRLTGSGLSVWTALIDFPIGINPVSSQIPESFALYQNYPNPFNPSTKIRFDIPTNAAGETTLKVYDQLGREVASLLNQNLAAGTYEINWDASEHASGVYYYTLKVRQAGSSTGYYLQSKKMVITK
jgi:hypothetical protein